MENPVGILNFGKSYLSAARHLYDEIIARRLSLPFDDPVSLLLGHSLELILKACLLQKEATEREAWGHDLIELRNGAIGKGCHLDLSVTEMGHLTRLNQAFGRFPHEVRYLKTGSVAAHDDAVIIGIAERFADEATRLIPGAVRCNFRPGG